MDIQTLVGLGFALIVGAICQLCFSQILYRGITADTNVAHLAELVFVPALVLLVTENGGLTTMVGASIALGNLFSTWWSMRFHHVPAPKVTVDLIPVKAWYRSPRT